MQYVIEANGNVYPCDFYVLDEVCVGNITQQTLWELFEHPLTQHFVCEKREYQTCEGCEFHKICRGGCKRMKDACYCGYREVLKKVLPTLLAKASPLVH